MNVSVKSLFKYNCIPYKGLGRTQVLFDGLTLILNELLKENNCGGCSLVTIDGDYIVVTTKDIKSALTLRDWMMGSGKAKQEHSWAPPNTFYEVKFEEL